MRDSNNNPITKGLEILEKSTKETRNALDNNTANGVKKIFELLKATPIGIKIDTYIAERPYKLEIAMNEMRKKYEKIPEERRIEPTAYIALQATNSLNYALDEEVIRNMFENILISDMDQNKKNIVQPGFIEIVKQLSKEDAAFLMYLKNNNMLTSVPIIRLKVTENDKNSYHYITNDIICLSNGEYMQTSPIVIDNLLRLKIIDIPSIEHLSNEAIYSKCYNNILQLNELEPYKNMEGKHLDYQKKKMDFTSYGLDFIKICID